MGQSCDSSNQKSIPDVETSINCPRIETESNTLSEEDNGHYILGPLGCAFYGFSWPQHHCNCWVLRYYT